MPSPASSWIVAKIVFSSQMPARPSWSARLTSIA
jgi:hypothetical protein